MTKSKFGMKEVPKTNPAKVEEQVVKDYYLPETKLEISGEDFAILLEVTRNSFQEGIAPVFNNNREIVGHALLPQNKPIEQILFYLESLHKSFIDRGLTCSKDDLKKYLENLSKTEVEKETV